MKDVVRGGDLPVVWTNTNYRMLYMNMGHGNKIFTNKVQNRLMEDAMTWVGAK
jgi:type 1 glutamine amidotransferase